MGAKHNKKMHFAILFPFLENGKTTKIKIEDQTKDFDVVDEILLREGDKLRVFCGWEGGYKDGIPVFYEVNFVEIKTL